MKVLVVCNGKFNATELLTLLRHLAKNNIPFDTCSKWDILEDERARKEQAKRGLKHPIKRFHPTILLPQVTPSNYTHFCIASGFPEHSMQYWDDATIRRIVQQVLNTNGVLAATCSSVPSLQQGLQGKRVSCFPTIAVKQHIAKHGGILSGVSATIDGNVVTSENEAMATMWSEAICKRILGQPVSFQLQPTTLLKRGSLRRLPKEITRMIDEAKSGKISGAHQKPS